jgi:hypothetical protein
MIDKARLRSLPSPTQIQRLPANRPGVPERAIFLAARCMGEVRKRNELGSIAGDLRDCVKALVRLGNGIRNAQVNVSVTEKGHE